MPDGPVEYSNAQSRKQCVKMVSTPEHQHQQYKYLIFIK